MDHDLLSPKAISKYYEYYFYNRSNEMSYPVWARNSPNVGCDTSILELLSGNEKFVESYRRANPYSPTLMLSHAFKTAGNEFRVIDAPTEGLIVPYGEEGRNLILELASSFCREAYSLKKQIQLLRRAQQFSVNVFPQTMKILNNNGCIHEIQEGAGIYYLDERHYNEAVGITMEETMNMTFLNV